MVRVKLDEIAQQAPRPKYTPACSVCADFGIIWLSAEPEPVSPALLRELAAAGAVRVCACAQGRWWTEHMGLLAAIDEIAAGELTAFLSHVEAGRRV